MYMLPSWIENECNIQFAKSRKVIQFFVKK